jgi:hypothetical protein
VRNRQLGSAQHLGKYSEGSRELTGTDPEKPSRPTTKHTRALNLSHTLPDSNGGITGAHQLSRRGAQTLRGSHPGSSLISSGLIFSLTVTRRSCEVGCIIWDSFQADQTSISSKANFPDICNNCREYPRLHPIDLCMHVVDSSRSSVYGYFLLFCIVFQRRSTLMRSS